MSRRRVLLLFDFSRSGYAAHYAVLKLHADQPLDLVLLVVGSRGRYPAPDSLRACAANLAEAHRACGGTTALRFSRAHPRQAVRSALKRRRFDLVVAGSELAECLAPDATVMWHIVPPAREAPEEPALWPFIMREQRPGGLARGASGPGRARRPRQPQRRNGPRGAARRAR